MLGLNSPKRVTNCGTAKHEEIIEGIEVATAIACMIRAVRNPAVQRMILKLLGLIEV